jgi:nucleoid-associated protein YgaU
MIYAYSRYRYCTAFRDSGAQLVLDEREPFRFADATDNRWHTAVDGDTWWSLAHRYFAGFPRACGLWWLLCEYQPVPVVDPTLRVQPGATIAIPSERLLRLYVFSADQRRYH